MNWQKWFEDEVSRVTDDAHARMMRDGGLYTLHLWYKQGALVALARDEDGLGYSYYGPLPRSLTRDQLRAWIHERARKLPILPVREVKP